MRSDLICPFALTTFARPHLPKNLPLDKQNIVVDHEQMMQDLKIFKHITYKERGSNLIYICSKAPEQK